MYEFNFISAANASVKQIEESRNNLINTLSNQLAKQLLDYVNMDDAVSPDTNSSGNETDTANKSKNTNSSDVSEENLSEEEKAYLKWYEESLNNENSEQSQNLNQEGTEQENLEEDLINNEEEADKVIEIMLDSLDPTANELINAYSRIIHHIQNSLNVVIEVDKLKDEEIKLKHIESLIKKSNAIGVPLSVYVSGYSKFNKDSTPVEMLFSQKLLNTFVALNNYLVNNGANPLRFLEEPLYPEWAWTMEEVAKANGEIDLIVDFIKMCNFSPLEAAAYIHQYITAQFGYKENDDKPTQPRSIVGILNSDDIVCVGYALFTKAIIDKLNMPGLKADTFVSVIRPKVKNMTPVKLENKFPIKGFAHEQNLITINDPKYNVKGTYITDACWDSKDKENPDGQGFANYMYPVTDLLHIKGQDFIQTEATPFDIEKKIMSTSSYKRSDSPLFTKYAKTSQPIPYDTIKNVVYSVYRKLYPIFTKKEIEQITNLIMEGSEIMASSIFDENAKSSLAKVGYEKNCEELDTSQIIK